MTSKEPIDIWVKNDKEFLSKYPFYIETMLMLEIVLEKARQNGVTGPQIASMLASLHAKSIAELNPNQEQKELSIAIFREALDTYQN